MLYFYRPTINWGRRLELGANTYRVLVHPTSTERALVVRDPRRSAWARASVRDATPVPMAVSSPSGGLHRHEHDGCPTTIVETNHSFEDSRAVGQGREVRAELDSAVVPDD